ncbi:MAG: hypothetical protein JO262_01520 [Solirubrobacterales bacterium]|nr:hypothetical protein [Solirubrobacterales bacterium]
MAQAPGDDRYAAVRILLAEFRLLEAAGVCELLARHSDPAGRPETPDWWSRLAATARAYRVAILGTFRDGEGAIRQWAENNLGPSDAWCFPEERARLRLEFENWLEFVPGGMAYVAWLSGYVAAAEFDGRTAAESLRRCAAIAADFVEGPGVPVARSVYEQLQLTADVLTQFLPLPQHPLRDMRRFALLPETFRN